MAGWLKLSWIVLLIFVLRRKILVTGEMKPNWTYEFLSVEVENKTPDKAIVGMHLTRISRGVYGISGFIEIKEDLTNDFYASVAVYYSMTGSNYIKTPIQMLPTNLEKSMNVYYKDFLQETFLNCSDNAPRVEDKFVPPLEKRTVHLKNCIFMSDNMPARLQSGFYKVVISLTKQIMTEMVSVIKVEPMD